MINTIDPEEQSPEERTRYLRDQIQAIGVQLEIRMPTKDDAPEDKAAYTEWRHRAIYARLMLRRELKAITSEIHAENERRRAENLERRAATSSRPRLVPALAAKLDELGIDYTTNELDNLKRRIAAEGHCDLMRGLLAELVAEFREHDPCGSGCTACDLIERAAEEAR